MVKKMAKSFAIVRFVMFCIFFSAGAGAIALSILAEELKIYHENKITHARILAQNEKIKDLITRYDQQIQYIETEPNRISVLKHITFGGPEDSSAEHPKASLQELAAASKALVDNSEDQSTPDIPPWVLRSAEPKNRRTLFFAGAGLVLITFIFFGTPGEKK
jgi:hypothetical protein